MSKVQVSPSPEIHTTKYGGFRGADFSTDSSLVGANRSPMPLNMLPDYDGTMVKRVGWRKVKEFTDREILDIQPFYLYGIKYFLAIVKKTKTYFYVLDNRLNFIKESQISGYDGNFKGRSICKFKREGLEYIYARIGSLTTIYGGAQNDLKFYSATDYFTVPLYMIGGQMGGEGVINGTPHEPLNMLVPRLRVRLTGDNTHTTFQLPHFKGHVKQILKVRRLIKSGTGWKWGELSEGHSYLITSLSFGIMKLTEPHPTPISGQDNIEVEYEISPYPILEQDKVFEKNSLYWHSLLDADMDCWYGYGAHNRLFMASETDSRIFYSAENDPLYFPSSNWLQIGAQAGEICGFLRSGKDLGVIKKNTGEDTNIFVCSANHENGKTGFSIHPSVAGEGGISRHTNGVLNDEPLFLNKNGVQGLNMNLLNYERSIKNRSYFLNPKLTKEANLETAISTVYNGFYILCVNSRCYVLDGRHKTALPADGEYSYDGYFLENIPAERFIVSDGLYFISGGKLYKFNDDIDNLSKYSDGGTLDVATGRIVGGAAIPAQWSTPADDDVGLHRYKTLIKKGCLASIKPYDRSSAKIYIVKDGDPIEFIAGGRFDIFDWNNIDFEKFSFDGSEVPREIYFNKKKKKYKRLQIVITNDEIDEGFGIYQIIKNYIINNFSKDRW